MTQPFTYEPIPAETAAAVRPAVGQLVETIIASVKAENPVYAEVLSGPEGVGIRIGIEQAVKSFLDGIERGEPPEADTAEVWRRLGEAEFQAGRSLEALRAAWRTGTRAAWRGAAELGAAAGIPTQTVIALAEAIFVYTDGLGTDVVEGYIRIQSDQEGERERRRRQLGSLLLDGDDHDAEAIARAADLARWTVPQALAVIAIDIDRSAEVLRRLDTDVLAGTDRDGAWLIIPDPEAPGRAATVARAVENTDAALGPVVAPRDANRSLRWARTTLGLVRRGALPSEHPTPTMDHLAEVILLHDDELARALIDRTLAPFSGMSDGERSRLFETLQSWLAHQRHTPAVAEALNVHPQTVRYRIAKLRELLGDTLETASGRFELELALRARAALDGGEA